jgi:uncharacterized protein YegL
MKRERKGSNHMPDNPLAVVEFAANPERRCPVVLVLDTSGSMSGDPIRRVNEGIRTFEEQIRANTLAALRVEVAVVTFGGSAKVMDIRGGAETPTADTAFVTVDNFQAPMLVAEGQTPMGEAVRLALQLLRDRKNIYQSNGISYYRPWLMLISDGVPTDNQWEQAAMEAVAEEQRNGVSVFPVAVESSAMPVLQRFSVKQTPLQLQDVGHFDELFTWLSDSLSAIANSQPGEQVPLPSPSGWAVFQP